MSKLLFPVLNLSEYSSSIATPQSKLKEPRRRIKLQENDGRRETKADGICDLTYKSTESFQKKKRKKKNNKKRRMNKQQKLNNDYVESSQYRLTKLNRLNFLNFIYRYIMMSSYIYLFFS